MAPLPNQGRESARLMAQANCRLGGVNSSKRLLRSRRVVGTGIQRSKLDRCRRRVTALARTQIAERMCPLRLEWVTADLLLAGRARRALCQARGSHLSRRLDQLKLVDECGRCIRKTDDRPPRISIRDVAMAVAGKQKNSNDAAAAVRTILRSTPDLKEKNLWVDLHDRFGRRPVLLIWANAITGAATQHDAHRRSPIARAIVIKQLVSLRSHRLRPRATQPPRGLR